MLQRNRRTASGKYHFLWGLVTAAGMMAALWSRPCVAWADATATVKAGSAKIRESTDTNSAVVSSTSQGKTITITGETTDAAGVAWYQVYVDADTTGYIRADLVEKNNDGDIPQITSNSGGGQDAPQEGEGTASDSETAGAADSAMDAQYATISVEAVNVRTSPSKNDASVARLEKDSRVVVSGQSNGSDGKTWYYVTFTGEDGSEKAGFIRSDLLTLGDMVPVPEAEVPEEPETEPEPETPVNNDYELVYQLEADGSYAWYLHDNVGQSKQRLQQILDAAAQGQSGDSAEDAKVLVRQRIAIVALAVVVVVLVIVIIVMAVRLRDAYYEDYEDDEDEDDDDDDDDDDDEDDDEDDEDEEEIIDKRRNRVEEAAPRRRRPAAEEVAVERPARKRAAQESRKSGIREVEYQDDGGGNVMVSPSPKRKAKNFLIDDDDFEFEFLNMDDKKS